MFQFQPTPLVTDLLFVNLGTHTLVRPITDTAIDWAANWFCDEFPGDVLVIHGAIVLEPESVPSVITAARNAALIVEG